jgi:dsRNA-specific ribonuclease
MQDISITTSFMNFVYNLLRFRCNLKESTVTDFFIKNKESMTLFRQAFIHSTYSGDTNYELLEFEGDGVIGSAVVQYIRRKFPEMISVRWNTRMKHHLVSSKVLAKMAINNGFEEFLVISSDLQAYIESFEDKWDCSEYQAAYEDTVEAVCGVIMEVLNKYTAQGVGDTACYNLISSFLDEYEIPIKYEDLFDAKSRLKEVFDSQGWNNIKGCNLGNCLVTIDVDDEQLLNRYKKDIKSITDRKILDSTDKYITLGYACMAGNPRDKKLLIVTTANTKSNAEQPAAEVIIERLKRYGISIPIPDMYEKKSKKVKKYVVNEQQKMTLRERMG